jgi:hypothetical protein
MFSQQPIALEISSTQSLIRKSPSKLARFVQKHFAVSLFKTALSISNFACIFRCRNTWKKGHYKKGFILVIWSCGVACDINKHNSYGKSFVSRKVSGAVVSNRKFAVTHLLFAKGFNDARYIVDLALQYGY